LALMGLLSRLRTQLKLRYLLFFLLLLLGIVPVLVSNLLLARQNREYLQTQEKTNLTRSAEALSSELNESLANTAHQLGQLGEALLAAPGPDDVTDRLREPWVGAYVGGFMRSNPDLLALRVVERGGAGIRFAPADLRAESGAALDAGFEEARSRGAIVYRFVEATGGNEPNAVIASPVGALPGAEPRLIVEALTRLELIDAVFRREARGAVDVFLIDNTGKMLWSEGADEPMRQAVTKSDLVRDFLRKPLNLTSEYDLDVNGKSQGMLGQVSPVAETGWAVVVQKPAAAAFEFVRRMVWNTLIASLVLVALALAAAAFAASRISQPIQRLASTSHEIAEGNFGQRVEVEGVGAEIAALARDFNRMSGHVQSHVEQLKRAAAVNRDLFISSIRAFAAAIDAKDPYTRGHSERVAAFSRTIARHLALKEEILHRVWIGALLHDVGKIGIEDRILKKGGVLSAEEYEQMKLHPVIGAEILSPIEQLKEMLPAVRWHHEAWNGRGYPDALKGEEIPLLARIVGVADCFDAITTSRPYQRAYAPAFAVETITKLAGSRFDAKVVTAFLKAFEAGEIQAAPEELETPDARAVVGA
jgi:HD-GYP domain-containing protein (c-di-GMP phosphodiesterase class II)